MSRRRSNPSLFEDRYRGVSDTLKTPVQLQKAFEQRVDKETPSLDQMWNRGQAQTPNPETTFNPTAAPQPVAQSPASGDRLMVGGRDMTTFARAQQSPLQNFVEQSRPQDTFATPAPVDSWAVNATPQHHQAWRDSQYPYHFKGHPDEGITQGTMQTIREAQGLGNDEFPANIVRNDNFQQPVAPAPNPVLQRPEIDPSVTQRPEYSMDYQGIDESAAPVDPRQTVLDSFNDAFRNRPNSPLSEQDIANAQENARMEGLVFDPERGFELADETSTDRTRRQLEKAYGVPTISGIMDLPAGQAPGVRTDPQGRPIPPGFNTRAEAFPEYEAYASDREIRAEQAWNAATEARRPQDNFTTRGGAGEQGPRIPADVRAIMAKGGPTNEREAQRIADWENSSSGRAVGGLAGYQLNQQLTAQEASGNLQNRQRLEFAEEAGNLQNRQRLEFAEQNFEAELGRLGRLDNFQVQQEADRLGVDTTGMSRAEVDRALANVRIANELEDRGQLAVGQQVINFGLEDNELARNVRLAGGDPDAMTAQEQLSFLRQREFSRQLGLDMPELTEEEKGQLIERLETTSNQLQGVFAQIEDAMAIPPGEENLIRDRATQSAFANIPAGRERTRLERLPHDQRMANPVFAGAYESAYLEGLEAASQRRQQSPGVMALLATAQGLTNFYGTILAQNLQTGALPDEFGRMPERRATGAPLSDLGVDELLSNAGAGEEADNFTPTGSDPEPAFVPEGDVLRSIEVRNLNGMNHLVVPDGYTITREGFVVRHENVDENGDRRDWHSYDEKSDPRNYRFNEEQVLPLGTSIDPESGKVSLPDGWWLANGRVRRSLAQVSRGVQRPGTTRW